VQANKDVVCLSGINTIHWISSRGEMMYYIPSILWSLVPGYHTPDKLNTLVLI
jgi:hypothetical protein